MDIKPTDGCVFECPGVSCHVTVFPDITCRDAVAKEVGRVSITFQYDFSFTSSWKQVRKTCLELNISGSCEVIFMISLLFRHIPTQSVGGADILAYEPNLGEKSSEEFTT